MIIKPKITRPIKLTEKQKFVARLISDYGLTRNEAIKSCSVFKTEGIYDCNDALNQFEANRRNRMKLNTKDYNNEY